MSKPDYTREAVRDLEEILEFIARDKPDAAIKWIEEIEAKCLVIASSPEIGEVIPRLGSGVRTRPQLESPTQGTAQTPIQEMLCETSRMQVFEA